MVAPTRTGTSPKPKGRGRRSASSPTWKPWKLSILDIEFVNDHPPILDSTDHLTHNIEQHQPFPYEKPHWIAVDDSFAIDHRPVTADRGKHMKVRVRVKFDAPHGTTITAKLSGLVPVFGREFSEPSFRGEITRKAFFRSEEIVFKGGDPVTVEMTSLEPLPNRVDKFAFKIEWRFRGDKIMTVGAPAHPWVLAPLRRSKHQLYVTMGPPSTPPQYSGITHKRLEFAVNAVGAVWIAKKDPKPIDLVEHLMERFSSRFNLQNPLPDPWALIDASTNTDCITICEFVLCILKMVGCPGTIEPVLVYEQLQGSFESWGQRGVIYPHDNENKPIYGDDGKKVRVPALFIDRRVNDPKPGDFRAVAKAVKRGQKMGGLGYPVIAELDPEKSTPKVPQYKSYVTLTLGGPDHNDFEACLQFKEGGKTYFFPGGVSPRKNGLLATSPGEVLRRVFYSLRWRGKNANQGEHIRVY